MSNYPAQYDDDSTIIRIDDNIDELGTEAINQIREAIFAEQSTLGLNPQGTKANVAERLDVSLNSNGTIKTSAIASIGLVTLPIDDAQIGISASIQESKLNLDYATSDLNTLIQTNSTLISSLQAFATITSNDLTLHIGGASALSGGGICRHIDNQIDLQGGGSYIVDINGTPRGVTTVQQALSAINTDLVNHQNDTVAAHAASAILVDTSGFTEIPETAVDVQSALDAIDDSDRLQIGAHRAVMHSNGVPKAARSEDPENIGYGTNVVPYTSCRAYLGDGTNSPNDSTTNGDNVIKFLPTISSPYDFDRAFTQVKLGDVLRINYGNGFESQFLIESIRYTPGVDFTVRINGINLFDTDGYDAVARIDRPLFDENLYGVFAVAAANNDIHSDILGSVIVGNPRAASAVGIGFDPNQLNSTHYNLYLNLFPTGNPQDKTIQTIGIDVTGNLGASPGKYTIDTVVQATNDSLRKAGWNQRFLAFSYKGEFGIMLADIINNASFSIINGIVSGGTLAAGSFSNNVIGDATDGLDALGLGVNRANVASPTVSSYTTPEAAANLPLLVHSPRRNRNAVVNGINVDNFAETPFTTDGYWSAIIYSAGVVGSSYQITYEVELDLSICDLAPGKTITAQPAISFTDPLYTDVDYGRFVIRNVEFIPPCGPTTACTRITVVNGTANTGNALFAGSAVGTEVLLYFGEDSVGFNALNVSDVSTGNQYNRLHEVYVTDDGNTFTHERARMIKQAGTSTLLNTADIGGGSPWTIVNVSPKLRGWRDDSSPSSTDFTKKVRFFVVNYISTTGEYDGYIGRASGAGVVEYGEVVRARKNVPARFYDATNVDYIELEFIEREPAVATPIMPDTSPRYVDIDIFPSLKLDDEVFLLATCEMDNLYVERVVDRREFGNVSEKDFSTSAISFIQAGDKHLHANGVIRGLGFRENGTVAGTLRFNGGVALINGAIVTINDGLVSIPQIRDSSSANVSWAICVNETGQFVAVLLTATKTQFFTSNQSTNYYVPSMTFAELVDTRKDLVIVAVVDVTISSINIDEVYDARRFVSGKSLNLLTVNITSSDELNAWGDDADDKSATFRSFYSLFFWANYYNIKEVFVDVINNSSVKEFFLPPIRMVGGTYNISEKLTLSGAEIYNATINVTSLLGLVGASVVSGCSFVYSPVAASYTANNMINFEHGFCLSVPSDSLTERNSFTSANNQRPPFIINSSSSIRNTRIINNTFTDTGLATDNSAICFAHSSASFATIRNILIANNQCNNSQNIVLPVNLAAWKFVGVKVENNICGFIGYHSTSDDISSELVISNNVCTLISSNISTSYGAYGHYSLTAGVSYYDTVIINGNIVSGIIRALGSGHITISNNRLNIVESALLLKINNSLVVSASLSANAIGSLCVISDNFINCVGGSTITATLGGISYIGDAPAFIKNNSILLSATAATIRMIYVNAGSSSTPVITSGNNLNRNGNAVANYIYYQQGSGQIIDNMLDSSFVDVANTDYANAIVTSSNTVTVERNKKHRGLITLSGADVHQKIFASAVGFDVIYAGINDITNVTSSTTADASQYAIYNVDSTGVSVIFNSDVNLTEFLPGNVRVVNVYSVVTTNSIALWSSGSVELTVISNGSSVTDSINIQTTASDTLSCTTNFISKSIILSFYNNVTRNGTPGPASVVIGSVSVLYEW